MDTEDFKHPSYGLVRLGRVSGQTILFGSNVQHQHYISLTISTAKLSRNKDTHEDYIHAQDQLIQINMSNVQLADMLTNMNCGTGVPCTLDRVMNCETGKVESIKHPDKIDTNTQTYIDEFQEKLKGISAKLSTLQEQVTAVLESKTPNKAQREALLNEVHRIKTELSSNMPFILEQFIEKVEKVTSHAKAEVEAHHSAIIQNLGMQALKEKNPEFLLE